MKIIVPMAGRGSRLRPHTLTVPKPLLPLAGKPIVQRLIEDITKVCNEAVDEIAFVIGDFGSDVEKSLINIAESLGAKGSIYHQIEPLGTAHAILCAKKSMIGNIVVAFADTLFKADFKLDTSADGIIWVKQIDNPEDFGVVKLDDNNVITDFIEKPSSPVSDLAIIGIYYFNDGEKLASELQYLIDNDIKEKGEYQLTNALENLKQKGEKFIPGKVDNWLDCGNKDVTVQTHSQMFELNPHYHKVSETAQLNNSVIIPPCYIANGATINNSIIGPNVSIGDNTNITRCNINNSIIQNNTNINNSIFSNSMIGNNVDYNGNVLDLSIGDFCVVKE